MYFAGTGRETHGRFQAGTENLGRKYWIRRSGSYTRKRVARQISKNGILGVNIMVATRKYEEYVKTAVEAGIDLIISGAGLKDYMVNGYFTAEF